MLQQKEFPRQENHPKVIGTPPPLLYPSNTAIGEFPGPTSTQLTHGTVNGRPKPRQVTQRWNFLHLPVMGIEAIQHLYI